MSWDGIQALWGFNGSPAAPGQSCVRKAEMAKVVVEVTFHAEESIVLQGVP